MGWLLARRKARSLFSTGSGLKKHLFRNRKIDICPLKVFFGKVSVMWKTARKATSSLSLQLDVTKSYRDDNCVPS